MNRREHARLARRLIEACGGLEEAARECRIGKSQLSEAQTPQGHAYLPADVIADLELYCGNPLYSRALADRFDAPCPAGHLRDAACDMSEAAVRLQAKTREAYADGEVSPRELDEIAEAERAAAEALERLRAIRKDIETKQLRPHLRAI